MDDNLKNSITNFIDAFELVFNKDWSYTKEKLGITEESKNQKSDAIDIKLGTVYSIEPNGTFLYPKVDDETEDWGYRGILLSEYRKLKKLVL